MEYHRNSQDLIILGQMKSVKNCLGEVETGSDQIRSDQICLMPTVKIKFGTLKIQSMIHFHTGDHRTGGVE